MNLIFHLIWSLLIWEALASRSPTAPVDLLLALLFGVALDADHFYHLSRRFGTSFVRSPEALRAYLRESQNPLSAPRYHTWLHELGGVLVVLALSTLIFRVYSSISAMVVIAAFAVHLLLDAVSVKMMPLAPFSRKEIYLGVISPGSRRERVFLVLSVLSLLIGAALFLIAPIQY